MKKKQPAVAKTKQREKIYSLEKLGPADMQKYPIGFEPGPRPTSTRHYRPEADLNVYPSSFQAHPVDLDKTHGLVSRKKKDAEVQTRDSDLKKSRRGSGRPGNGKTSNQGGGRK